MLQLSANSGVMLPSMLILVRPSSTLKCTISPMAAAGALVGSRPVGSSTMARMALSLRCCACAVNELAHRAAARAIAAYRREFEKA